MRYVLRKSSSRLTTTKNMIETRDGVVAMLVAVNDQPLSVPDQAREQARLNALLADPASSGIANRQRTRMPRAPWKSARAPHGISLSGRWAGPRKRGTVCIPAESKFLPPNLETQVLTEMSGEIWTTQPRRAWRVSRPPCSRM